MRVIVEAVAGVRMNASVSSLKTSLNRAGQRVRTPDPREEVGADAGHDCPSGGVARGGEDGAEGGVEEVAASEGAAEANASSMREGVESRAVDEAEVGDEVLGPKCKVLAK